MAFIPVNANDRVIVVTATSDGQTVFNFDFLAYSEDQIKAIKENLSDNARTDLVLNTDYTVAGLNQQNGGSITLSGVSIVTGDKIVIYSETEISRVSGYAQSGDFLAETVNREEDLQTMVAQEQQRDLDRTVKSEQGKSAFTITQGSENQTLKFDASGNLVPGPTTTQIENAEQSAIDAEAAATEAEGHAQDAAAANPANQLLKAANLNDLPDKPTARANLGLGSMATEASSAYVTQAAKADNSAVDNGTSDSLWMTPKKVVRAIDQRAPVLLQTVVVADEATARLDTGFDDTAFWGYGVIGHSIKPITASSELRLRTTGNGFALPADVGASDYSYGFTNPRFGTGLGQLTDNNSSFIQITSAVGNGANQGGADFDLSFKEPALLRPTYFRIASQYENDVGDWRSIDGGAQRKAAADLNGLQFYFSSGNIASGTFHLIGYPRLD